MSLLDAMQPSGHEETVAHYDAATGLRAIVSIHSTVLGPALGGTRWHPYATEDEALEDVLRLSSAMTAKAAVAGLSVGGGKAVVLGDPAEKTEQLLHAYSRFIDGIGGRYITTTDVGTTMADIDVLREITPYAAGGSPARGGSGDTSELTAVTVLDGMRASLQVAFGDESFAGRRIVIVGVGKVGARLARAAVERGAVVAIADVRAELAGALARELGVDLLPVDAAMFKECDILSPNALGHVLTPETIPLLRCRIVCGAANNQLANDPDDARVLAERGILYAPDYVVNSGGLISVAMEYERRSAKDARALAGRVYDTTLAIFEEAARRGIPTADVATEMATRRLDEARAARAGGASARSRTRAREVAAPSTVDLDEDGDGHFMTVSSRPIRRLYGPRDLLVQGFDYEHDLADPGEYPFTRGLHATGYRGRPWTIRMFSGFGSVDETNRRLKDLLAHGETGLSIAFDMPTLMGYDHDHEQAFGEFGKCGVAVSSLADMERLFDGIPLDRVSTSMTINGPAPVIWAMHIATAERQGVDRSQLRGTLQNDILKEYIAQNEFIFPPAASMRLVTDTIAFATESMPLWNPISVSGYHIREAGSTAAQELAFTLANGFEYVRWALERGLDVDAFAPRISFFFNAHNDLFEEVAKYRAARRIWARAMRERFGAKQSRSWWMRFHTQTAGVALTDVQPEVNLVRVAIQALAGALGGTQSMHTNAMDEALALPSAKAARLAVRTQQVLQQESGVVNTVDPLGGSYFIETLTNELERDAEAYFRRIEDMGGMIAAIDAGFPQQEIADAAYRFQQEVAEGRRTVVGVNAYQVDEPLDIPILRMDPEGEARHLERLRALRRERDAAQAEEALRRLEAACADERQNTMPYILDAVRAYCTLGEITEAMRRVFGEYRWRTDV